MADKLTLDRQAMKNRATSHLRIYVGGIVDKATVDDLYEHFIQFGQINGIIVNRNFGFVQFETEQSAQDAIAKADGSLLLGKTISVRTAQTNTDKRHTEGVTVQPELPPAVALSDNIPVVNDDAGDDLYDSYGNFKGEQNYGDEGYEDGYNQGWEAREAPRGGPRGRGVPRGRGRGARGRGAPGFRDRSPVPGRDYSDEGYEDGYNQGWEAREAPRGGPRGRGVPRGRGRGARGRGAPGFRDRSPVPGRGGYDRFSHPDYPRAIPVTERNDCEIIVVSKALTEYAEYIEGRLKQLGIVVDLLFPMEDVPIGKVLGNIASRGCLYAILVMPQNQEHRSLTLTILHGLPQEHRNIPLEDALQLISRNFQEVQRGGPSGREAVYALLGQLADGRALTVLQYDKVIEYLQERKEHQIKVELGEPLTPAPTTNKAQVDLQQRIMSILNDKKVAAPVEPVPAPVAAPAPAQNKLLNDPTVRKALDSILQKFT